MKPVLLVLLVLGILTGCKSAPEKITAAAPATNAPVAEANELAPPAPKKFPHRKMPTLFIVGDSTVHNAAPGLLGWGDVIGHYFDTNKIIVENHARPGRSSRTFQTQGWWTNILAAARPGDFVLIQMGHNDESPIADTNRARGTLRGLGEETTNVYNPVRRTPETVHTYGWYLRKYVTDARAKGMTPIICSPVPRLPRAAVTADFAESTAYVEWSEEIARNEHTYFINLNHLVLNHFIGLKPEEIRTTYYTTQDTTHFSPNGADLNARCVIDGLHDLNGCSLNVFLVPEPAPN